ncbi:acyl carrier protein [Paludibaculum fermentans]|uniref:Acyl carrier protein n=1 Tax=Paludibaculum fermentans TaxID=1473598 RepID=A0A7S7NK90_PALFE|nr:phosphopantetheine-binding protein [Paludibaculum fermentans]QOY85157.1 acyl carrier protein [Paludibaculum fermentans]
MDRRSKLIEILKTVTKQDTLPEPGDSLFDSGLLDSFALPDLVSALEQEFSIQIPDADLNPRKFDSIERIEEYLDSRN